MRVYSFNKCTNQINVIETRTLVELLVLEEGYTYQCYPSSMRIKTWLWRNCDQVPFIYVHEQEIPEAIRLLEVLHEN